MNRKQKWILAGMVLALLIVCIVSLLFGVWNGSSLFDAQMLRMIRLLRLPRLLGGLLAGSALAVSGALVQSVLHNSLASSNLIGINAGCGFFTLLAAWVFPASFAAGTISGLVGGLLAASLILALMIFKKPSRLTILLAGLAISQVFSAGIDLLMTLEPDLVSSYASFKIGSLAMMNMQTAVKAACVIVPALIAALLCAGQLQLFELSSLQAQALGLPVRKWMVLLLGLAALLSAGTVSFCGLIGFVGLIVPAFLKRAGYTSFWYLIACMLAGALLLCTADFLGRVIAMPWELPAGLILSLAGGPFFLYLLLERKHSHA